MRVHSSSLILLTRYRTKFRGFLGEASSPVSDNHLFARQVYMPPRLTPTETGVRSSTRHAPWVRQSARGAARFAAVPGDSRGGVTGAHDDLLLSHSPRDAGALARRGPRVLRLAIPIQLLLFPVTVPPFFEGLDLGGGRTGIPP